MTTVLVAVRTVHESAAVCDYLAGRGDVEAVVGVGVAPSDDTDAARDAGEALNVLAVRLPGLAVETEQRAGDEVQVVLAADGDHEIDEVVVAEGYDEADRLAAAIDDPVEVVADPVGEP